MVNLFHGCNEAECSPHMPRQGCADDEGCQQVVRAQASTLLPTLHYLMLFCLGNMLRYAIQEQVMGRKIDCEQYAIYGKM